VPPCVAEFSLQATVRVRTHCQLDRATLIAAGLLWVIVICFGSRALLNYSSNPGESGAPPQKWPTSSRLIATPNRPTLVMTLHPRCTCSLASLAELQSFLARSLRPTSTYLLFHREGEADASSGELWKRAQAIPGVVVISDDGTEAAIFHANTSGQTMLYDASGNLRFKGGITGARGHEGENFGLDALLAALLPSTRPVATVPVFGCSLHDPSDYELRKDPAWKKR
jgi:hypothetical protein